MVPVPAGMAGSMRTGRLPVRGIDYHVRHWGPEDAPPVLLLHGWMDAGASFRFLAEAMPPRWHLIAPDWRGFGRTAWAAGGYWFPDYVADLEILVDHFSPSQPLPIVGHSLGGNVAGLYAGIRPERVSRLALLEGFGIPSGSAAEAPKRYRRWLDAMRTGPRFGEYRDFDAVADRLQQNAPFLRRDRALWLAGEWAAEGADGVVRLRSDPKHRLPFPTVYRFEETVAIWQGISAPALWVEGSHSHVIEALKPHGGVSARLAMMPGARLARVESASHNLHIEQPEAVAAIVEAFLDGGPLPPDAAR